MGLFYFSAHDRDAHFLRDRLYEYYTNPYITVICINAESPAAFAPSFGIDNPTLSLLIIRENIVLFCEPLAGRFWQSVQSISDQALLLDMAEIRKRIQIEQESLLHLFGRNVCPMSKRACN